MGFLGDLLVRAIFRTVRIRSEGEARTRRSLQRSTPFIAAIWHSRILMFSYLYAGWRAAILVSASADGEIIARILARQGHEPVRGSTSRGGRKALAELVRRIRKGRHAVIIPDGPRGPRFRVQPGIIALARKTGAPILPMTYSARRGHAFNSWDRFLAPAPFTRCRVVYGRPLYVPAELDAAGFEDARRRLEMEMNRITLAADRSCGRDDIAPPDFARSPAPFTDSP